MSEGERLLGGKLVRPRVTPARNGEHGSEKIAHAGCAAGSSGKTGQSERFHHRLERVLVLVERA